MPRRPPVGSVAVSADAAVFTAFFTEFDSTLARLDQNIQTGHYGCPAPTSECTKAQALSAITQCQAAIAGALRQVKAAPGGKMMVPGWGDEGLASIVGVLAKAARLIQAKG